MLISDLPEIHTGQYLKLRDFIPIERLTENKEIFSSRCFLKMKTLGSF